MMSVINKNILIQIIQIPHENVYEYETKTL